MVGPKEGRSFVASIRDPNRGKKPPKGNSNGFLF